MAAGRKSEAEHAAERIAKGLDDGVPDEEIDPADAQRVGDAAASPQPEPGEHPTRTRKQR